ncbi:LacI family DNA-binding transcriptional regulator [Candidatus Aerophobetes bacterium]|nr:LacI family DNA-binding transcriptional regulator [Candidatus Aerophobetes bacterium]
MREIVTIKDVAKRAGVSTSTVSRILTPRNNTYMRDATRERVTRAIKELDYRPDVRAQSLRGMIGTKTIGLVMPDTLNPYYQELAYALEEICYKERYGMLVCSSKNSISRELVYIDLLERQKVDGIILTTVGLHKARLDGLIKRGIPIVLIDRDVPGTVVPTLFSNNYMGGCQATQYLIDLGHKKILCVAGSMNVLSNIDRLKGYTDTLGKNGLEIDKKLIIRKGKLTYKNGYKIMKDLLSKSGDEFTAIFCLNDLVALGVMRAIHEKGKNVPSDYSVIGFDNISFSSICNPPLTTIAQPTRIIALNAFKTIRKWKEQALLKKKHRFWDTKLIVRESCRENRFR